jgi:hypothetical protein
MFRNCTVTLIGCLVLLLTAAPVVAQQDPFGTLDVVYIDSVTTTPGGTVTVRVNVRNDETLGSLSVPIVYDTELLTLTSLSFANSRVAYLNTRMFTPATVGSINGHFLATAIQMFNENPIPVGDGLFFTAVFKVHDSAEIGTLGVIDTCSTRPAAN